MEEEIGRGKEAGRTYEQITHSPAPSPTPVSRFACLTHQKKVEERGKNVASLQFHGLKQTGTKGAQPAAKGGEID